MLYGIRVICLLECVFDGLDVDQKRIYLFARCLYLVILGVEDHRLLKTMALLLHDTLNAVGKKL